MLRYSIAVAALIATSSFALADPMDHDKGGSMKMDGGAGMKMDNSAGPARDGGLSKDRAPGQLKGDRESASELAPGKVKKDDSAARADDKNFGDRKGDKADKAEMNKPDGNRDAKMDSADKAKNASKDRDDNSRNAANKLDNSSGTGASEGTEGKGGPKGSVANVTSEQRTKVKGIFTQHRVEPAHINVSVNIGVAIPRTVHLYPVPEDIVLIVPEYRGYEYVLLDDDRVAIIDPDTYEVVDIIVIA